MPEMDGYASARWLRANGSELSIVALTDHEMSDDLKRCMDVGYNAYTSMPIRNAILVAICLDWAGNAIAWR